MSVYFLQAGEDGPVKVGTARDAAARLGSLQCGNPTPLRLVAEIVGGRDLERAIHRALAPVRIRGEWYSQECALPIAADLAAGGDVRSILDRWAAQCSNEAAEMARQREARLSAIKAEIASVFAAAVAQHGAAAVIEVCGFSSRSLRDVLSGRRVPRAHRVFNLLCLDRRALDPIFRLIDRLLELRKVPSIGRSAA